MADIAIVEQEEITSVEQLQSLIRDEEAFTKFFKKELFEQGFGKGEWVQDGKRGWRFNFSDGSYIRLKFFDTIKRIFNSKNVEVPGRESYLSYIDVGVMPAGIKGYAFTSDAAQHTMAYAKGRSPAKELHTKSIEKLREKATAVGIDLDLEEAWETYFARCL
jgi:hypothetical protein